jgi:virulence factor Mce-like protein
MRRNRGRVVSNPGLVGATTVLVVLVAVFLSYNANSGLPFVPSYDLNVAVPDAAGLIRGDAVRMGGTRVGFVSSISGVVASNGASSAVLHVKLDKKVEPLPVDTTVLVRPQSPLGLKYLEITRGHAGASLAAGATIPSSHTRLPVEIDDFFNIFDKPTRAAATQNLDVFGTAFAGRGASINQALANLGPLVNHLYPVMLNLMDGRTGWARLFPSLEQAAGEVAPVAQQNADLFAALDRTFTPLSQSTAALQAAISGGPPALDTATRELPAQARFINDSTELFRRFRPAFSNLASASRNLAPAFQAGIPALRRASSLNGRLTTTLTALERFGQDPRVVPGLARLTETANLLVPPIAFVTPAQTTCNYLALFFRNVESALSESDVVGSFLRIGIMALPQLPNSEAGPASAPANGPLPAPGLSIIQKSLVADSFLHSNPYPNTAAPGQTHECEAGNETYLQGRQVIGNEPGNQTAVTEHTSRTLP